ncbi:MAG: M14 family zinc carboxypeptidase [Leptospirales bacterium]
MEEIDNEEIKKSIPYEKPDTAVFSGPGWQTLGKSLQGRDISGKFIPASRDSKGKVLLLGGVHGNETEGVRFMEDFTHEFGTGDAKSNLNIDLYLLPIVNPDGFFAFERQNSNGVDLNRNMQTKDWTAEFEEPRYNPGKAANSEIETKAIVDLMENFQPDFIISFHSWKPMINTNGPSEKFAALIAEKLPMPVTPDIGYPTPGSLGTYAGMERKIPTITLEFERGIALDTVYSLARDGILNSFNVFE